MELKVKRWLIVFSIFVMTLIPMHIYARGYDVNYKGLTMEQVIRDLRKKTGYEFVYQKQAIQNVSLITCKGNNMTLEGMLDMVINDEAGLEYEVVGKTIVIKKDDVKKKQMSTRTISGRVLDDKGQPLQWATIKIRNTGVGTTTNEDGTFSLNVNSSVS